MQKLVLGLISLYQKTLSPDHGFMRVYYPYGYCKFHPSCSEFCRQSIVKFGLWRGLSLGGLRVLRCRPSAAPQIELVN